MMMNKNKWLVLLLFTIAVQAGCSSNKYRQPISKFQAAAAIVSADARKTYSEINRLQRTAEIRKRARNGATITRNDLEAVQPLNKANLQARLDALDRLNDYIDLLVSIANSDAPENISKSATDLTPLTTSLTPLEALALETQTSRTR
jgi:hypothetical protein